jgi:Holliday junction DNA helicase RuvA
MTPSQLEKAVSKDDVRAISKAQGIGSKTAQLIILKLKDKLELYKTYGDENVNVGGQNASDALEALVALGYTKADASKVIGTMNVSSMTVEDIIREALKRMN